jgi:DNA-binding MarR family transcriptional regulator
MDAAPAPGALVLLTRLARLVYRRSSEQLLGMRLKQFGTLYYLRDHGGVLQSDLGEALHFDANNLVLLLNDLEAAGLAERRRDPHDRRRHIVEITPAGIRAIERAEEGMGTLEDEVLGALSDSEQARLRSLLEKALEGQVRTREAALAGRD